jgi:hypothetical protein
MATFAAVEKQIQEREGFRVKLTPLNGSVKSLPAYEFTVMAPQRWKLSEWKNERLSQYVALVRAVTVYRGNGAIVKLDVQLGNLRDSYYQAEYAVLTTHPNNVVRLDRGAAIKAEREMGSKPKRNS